MTPGRLFLTSKFAWIDAMHLRAVAHVPPPLGYLVERRAFGVGEEERHLRSPDVVTSLWSLHRVFGVERCLDLSAELGGAELLESGLKMRERVTVCNPARTYDAPRVTRVVNRMLQRDPGAERVPQQRVVAKFEGLGEACDTVGPAASYGGR